MAFVSDTCTGSDGTAFQSHTGETGATWTEHPSFTADAKISDANRVRGTSAGSASVYYASGVPATADYDVSATLRQLTSSGNAGVCGRMDTTADTYYWARHNTGNWQIFKIVAGAATQLGSNYADAIGNGNERTVKLEMRGTAIKLYVDGVERVSATDSAISAKGKAGIRLTNGGGDLNSTGFHLDNISAADASSAPVNTVAPAVTGQVAVGKTLSCTTGTWTGDVSSGYAYQWKDASGNISGATSSTYVIGAGEVLKSIHCTVTATGTGGSTAQDSNTVGPIGTSVGDLVNVMELQTEIVTSVPLLILIRDQTPTILAAHIL